MTSESCYLVNVRWPSDLKGEEYNDNTAKMLYQHTLQLLKYDGLEATRKGGSNGKTTYSNGKILSLLNTNTAFIRKGKGVKFVKLDKTWSCYYLASGGMKESEYLTERSVKCWKYSQPQRGVNLN